MSNIFQNFNSNSKRGVTKCFTLLQSKIQYVMHMRDWVAVF